MLLSFSRRAYQLTDNADKMETFCAADSIAASCLSEIAPCPTSSCDTVAAIVDFHQGGKLVGILLSSSAAAMNAAFHSRSEKGSALLYFVPLSFPTVLLRS